MSTNLSITERVLAFLKLTDDARINAFYLKQQAQLNKDIKNLNKNLSTLKEQYDETIEDINEKLEDAKIRVEEAYEGVKPEDVATNEKASSFADVYWNTIEEAEGVVTDLEHELQSALEDYEDDKKEIEEQIAERQKRLAKLS
jgi:peptidoglycan hydrolase CwlO-like protein